MGVVRHWVGDASHHYYDNVANWSETLGGSGGASVPSATDDEAIFTSPVSLSVNIRTTVSCTITLTGSTFCSLIVMKGGTLTLQADLTGWYEFKLYDPIGPTTGQCNLTTNNHNISALNGILLNQLAIGYVAVLGSSVLTVGGDNHDDYLTVNDGNVNMDADEATFVMNPTSPYGGNVTLSAGSYGTIQINLNSSGVFQFNLNYAPTIGTVILSGNGLVLPSDITCSYFYATGTTSGGLILGESAYSWALTVATGTVNAENCTLIGSTATGGANFRAMNGCINGGENTGWTFPEQLYMPLFSLHGELKGTPPIITSVLTFPLLSIGSNLQNTPAAVTTVVEIPFFEARIEGGAEVSITYPSLILSCTAVINPIAFVNRYLPKLELEATSYQDIQAQLSSQIPLISISSTAFINEISKLVMNLPFLEISSSALAGDTVNFNREIPLLKLTSSAYWMMPGLLDSILPNLKLSASVRVVYSALSLNIKNQALSFYPTFDFNHMATFNGKPIGINRTGIYELLGTNDNNVDIPWKIRSGKLDLKKNHLRQVWLTGEEAGVVTLAIETAEGVRYEYPETSLYADENELRFKVGKGIKTRYFILELAGTDTALIDQIRVFGSPGERKR